MDPTFLAMCESFRSDCIRHYGPEALKYRIALHQTLQKQQNHRNSLIPANRNSLALAIGRNPVAPNSQTIPMALDMNVTTQNAGKESDMWKPSAAPEKPTNFSPKMRWYRDRFCEWIVCHLVKKSDFDLSMIMSSSHSSDQGGRHGENDPQLANAL
jgi:hypothetical protein